MTTFSQPVTPSFGYGSGFWTALESLDFGDATSPDGRAHPITASSPVTVVPPTQDPTTQGGIAGAAAGMTGPADGAFDPTTGASVGIVSSLTSAFPHLGVRLVVIVIGIGIVLLVAWRLVKP